MRRGRLEDDVARANRKGGPSHATRTTRRVEGLIPSPPCANGGVDTRTIEMDGVFPLALGAVWRLLHEHLDEATLREIHPWIRSGRVVRESQPVPFGGQMFPQSKVAEREIRIMGRRFRTTWTYAIEPPLRFAYEIRFENGSTTRRLLDRADDEDLAYANKPERAPDRNQKG